jgi:hypothetical protein
MPLKAMHPCFTYNVAVKLIICIIPFLFSVHSNSSDASKQSITPSHVAITEIYSFDLHRKKDPISNRLELFFSKIFICHWMN